GEHQLDKLGQPYRPPRRHRVRPRSRRALLVAGPAARAAAPAPELAISVDRVAIPSTLGGKFVFHSTIANRGTAPASALIAHLDVVSLRLNVYVDPEDW